MLLTTHLASDHNVYRLGIQPNLANKHWNDVEKIIQNLNIDKIIISYNLVYKNKNDMLELINSIRKYGNAHILVLRDPPSFRKDPVSCLISQKSDLLYRGCNFDITKGLPISQVSNIDDSVWTAVKGKLNSDELIDTHSKLCDNSSCATFINSEFIMRDSIHFNEKLSTETNQKLGNLLFSKMETNFK